MLDTAIKILTAKRGQTHLLSIGQAGFVIKSANGQFLGMDLYLSECVERIEGHVGFKRLLPKILESADIDFDVLIATHPHYDHFDMDSLPSMMDNQKTRLFASIECEREVKRLLISKANVTYVKPGDKATVGDFRIDFINCDHGMGAPDAVGLIITVDNKRFVVAGDTCLRLDRKEEYLKQGPIDILIAPINGAYGNLNEEECVQLSCALEPHLTIPCHYGMFASHGGNPGLFHKIMSEQHPERPYLLMAQGEILDLQ